jgi:glycosyltransferase involved in cell wall biosynthesis
MPETLSVAIIAFNESANLGRTLESVKWADELVILDSGSTDNSVAIAESFGAKVFVNKPFPGHGEQKNIAIDHCTCDWILLLDADEVISPELATEIRRVLAGPAKDNAYWISRLNLIFGRWMRHGGFYPDRKLRLFRRGTARLSEGVGPHSTPQFAGKPGFLKGDMQHYAYPTLPLYLEHMDRYSTELSKLIVPKGKTSRSLFAFVWNVVLNPVATFIYNYFFRLGFMDGREGLLLHLYHSSYVSWKYAKAWEAGRKHAQEPSR